MQYLLGVSSNTTKHLAEQKAALLSPVTLESIIPQRERVLSIDRSIGLSLHSGSYGTATRLSFAIFRDRNHAVRCLCEFNVVAGAGLSYEL